MKTSNKNEPLLSFKTPKAFEKWLAKNYDKTEGIQLRFLKKDSGEKTITYTEAVDEALCYGWINAQSNKYDEQSWIQKYTPRRQRSIWSKKNTENIERLTSLGKMQPSGFAEVEKAKTDGRWEKAYNPSSQMQIPDDFMKELSKNIKAKAFFESLNKTNKYAIAWRLQTAKKPETRDRRLKIILDMLTRSQKFH